MWASLRRYFSVLCVLIFGFTLSFGLFWVIHGWEKTSQKFEFESRAKAYSNALEVTLEEYAGALLFLGDYFDASNSVSRQDFLNVVRSMLPRYAGIQTIGWNPLVTHADRERYEALARQDGFTDYQFTERAGSQGLVRAGRRDEYVVVYYMYPKLGNEAAFGFDIASDSVRLNAIASSFSSGKLTATERITLVQETAHQFGVLVLRPIYHAGSALDTVADRLANRKGFVVEVLRVGNLVQTALRGFDDEGISLTLSDLSAQAGKQLLHHQASSMANRREPISREEAMSNELFWSKTINFAERQWNIAVIPSDHYLKSRWMWQSWLILTASLLMTVLLALYLFKKLAYQAAISKTIVEQAETNRLLGEEIEGRRVAELERDNTIDELKQALAEVKKLRGILPICASCKKIRDDQGYWNQIESYISDHSEAAFSHGICPDCAREFYPDSHKD